MAKQYTCVIGLRPVLLHEIEIITYNLKTLDKKNVFDNISGHIVSLLHSKSNIDFNLLIMPSGVSAYIFVVGS